MALTQSYHGQKQGFFSSLLDGLTRGMSQVVEANSRIREVERLQALSDEALAAKGIRRDDIVRHVFRDLYWL
ncbi:MULTISPECIES: hypothetical protein [Marivita]|uniref:DUF1127 domain-containing protein n=1 Tax=Marivita cryptomonadis TaxID=505252 RepID=A0A9Q2RYJ4_9RHOB|nr:MULTISPECIES: hypothetical protein [Marivita]MCR9166931.1 DUF1127 domain-containing protein [Paracoccaceae bacterium]MBM2322928.1 DUF1127 domain-containing protein [Marivita cryptomonadis]MBM2332520.1 DUF1127 domain-containing protein [Marivita cryptomonadis]MBM2342103.1 DUF1127 domain-containing protein [Marivita cryptomonadis]MBM2346758.1 DUF1127 domain-containing protein [Marivita cryptomonadis]